jgi:hypothetical protein
MRRHATAFHASSMCKRASLQDIILAAFKLFLQHSSVGLLTEPKGTAVGLLVFVPKKSKSSEF